MTGQQIEPGDVRRLTVTITNIDGDADDPTGLVFRMNAPGGTVTTYTYDTDAELVRVSAGVYYVDWPVAAAGTHRYAWESNGENAAYEEGWFIARARTVAAS